MRFHKPPSTGWYSKQLRITRPLASKASINATMMRQTRFREWYRRDYQKLNPVMHGFYAFEIEDQHLFGRLLPPAQRRRNGGAAAISTLNTRLAWGGPGRALGGWVSRV